VNSGSHHGILQGADAFWTDMAAYRGRITLVTMTEFGRRLQETAA